MEVARGGHFDFQRCRYSTLYHCTMDSDTDDIDAQIAALHAVKERKLAAARKAKEREARDAEKVLVGVTPTKGVWLVDERREDVTCSQHPALSSTPSSFPSLPV